jgi:hypothetical protein
MRINTLTADPALRYLLALEGRESPSVPVAEGWEVFKAFLELPADGEDVAGFQTSWIRENPDYPVFVVLFVRQLTDAADGGIRLMRAVALQFLFSCVPSRLVEVELWSSDFEDRTAFFAAVEDTDEFYYATKSALPDSGGVVLEAEETPPDDAAA